jgi:hypothetical protein
MEIHLLETKYGGECRQRLEETVGTARHMWRRMQTAIGRDSRNSKAYVRRKQTAIGRDSRNSKIYVEEQRHVQL